MKTHNHMMNTHNYCSTCGTKLILKEESESRSSYCPACEKPIYKDPKVATCTLVTNADNAILLAKRALEPGLGKWALPGGYVNLGEVVETAARREILEETGILCEITKLLGVFSAENTSPILIVYRAHTTGGTLTPSAETPEVGFFQSNDLPPLSFPRDYDIIVEHFLSLAIDPNLDPS